MKEVLVGLSKSEYRRLTIQGAIEGRNVDAEASITLNTSVKNDPAFKAFQRFKRGSKGGHSNFDDEGEYRGG